VPPAPRSFGGTDLVTGLEVEVIISSCAIKPIGASRHKGGHGIASDRHPRRQQASSASQNGYSDLEHGESRQVQLSTL
jgi:hypothetical protein